MHIIPHILKKIDRAEGGTRTHTEFPPQAPRACVSTSSTTSAIMIIRWNHLQVEFLLQGKIAQWAAIQLKE